MCIKSLLSVYEKPICYFCSNFLMKLYIYGLCDISFIFSLIEYAVLLIYYLPMFNLPICSGKSSAS